MASEQGPEPRAAWWQAVTMLDPEKLVFIDEAGTHTAMTRTHARAPKGQHAYGSVPRNRGGNLTLLAALSNSQIQAEWLIGGSVDGDVFVAWLEPLNEREVTLLRLLSAGHSNKSIAKELGLSPNTVKWYLKGLFVKLGSDGRLQAVNRAKELGLL